MNQQHKLRDKVIDLSSNKIFNIQDLNTSHLNIAVFESTDNFIYQRYAGKLLEDLNVRGDFDLVQVLKNTLDNWNKSVEQFPFWLKKNFSNEYLKKVFLEFINLI